MSMSLVVRKRVPGDLGGELKGFGGFLLTVYMVHEEQ